MPRPTTKDLLIATSERLFGRSGIDGVSLREIGAAAGQTNSNVVQYHFGDKRGLVIAIMNDRLRRLEAVRNQRLSMLDELKGAQRLRELLRLVAAHSRSRRTPPELPGLGTIRRLLRAHFGILSASTFKSRLTALSMMFLSAVVGHDNTRLLAPRGKLRPFALEPMLDLAIAALAAPVTKRGRQSAAPKAPQKHLALQS